MKIFFQKTTRVITRKYEVNDDQIDYFCENYCLKNIDEILPEEILEYFGSEELNERIVDDNETCEMYWNN